MNIAIWPLLASAIDIFFIRTEDITAPPATFVASDNVLPASFFGIRPSTESKINRYLLFSGLFFTSSNINSETVSKIFDSKTKQFPSFHYRDWETDRKSTRLNSSHSAKSRMPSSA